ncbi:MAG: rhodanese-like domain-containing protein [Turicibacter sp.]|nr:rhodanese-like domain-containing protein [Turicibacter sp.]
MKKLVGKIAFCLIFILLMIFAILEYQETDVTTSQFISDTSAIHYISQEESEQLMNETKGVIIIDVRNKSEYIKSHMENSINIPSRELNEHLNELEIYKDKAIILYCDSGSRSRTVAIQLEALGYKNLYVIQDGIN